MSLGVIVGFGLGLMFIFLGIFFYKKRNWKCEKIKEWEAEPKAIVKITGTIDANEKDENHSYRYRGEILIDNVWYVAESWDEFHNKRTCQNGEEIMVAYRPIADNEVLDSIMSAMVGALMNENWEEKKPRYRFKFVDENKYANEGSSGGAFFFIGFGLVILLMVILSWCGVIK